MQTCRRRPRNEALRTLLSNARRRFHLQVSQFFVFVFNTLFELMKKFRSQTDPRSNGTVRPTMYPICMPNQVHRVTIITVIVMLLK